jgi:hypothetical protein
MNNKSLSLVAGVLFLLSTSAFAQDKLEVHAQLKLVDNKTTFKIGEPIRLVLELTADRDGYLADATSDKSESSTDELSVTPDEGSVSHWRREAFGEYPRDYFSTAKLSAQPIKIQVELNDSIRFDRPGRYTVRYTTHRARPTSSSRDYLPSIPLTTNEVSFDVQAMSDAEEEQEVKRLSGLIDGAHDWQTQSKFARELAFLMGDTAAREKVRRFFSAQGSLPGNYFGEILTGLYITRNRALVLQLLEKAMRDPSTQVEASLLSTLTSLRFLEQNPRLAKPVPITFGPNQDPRIVEIEQSYVSELAAGLGKRGGKAQTVTAMTVLTHLPKDPKAAAPLLAESRQILIEQFENLSVFGHEQLLERYWDVLRDPALIPALKKLLVSTDRMTKGISKTVLKRLIDLSPDEARPYVIAEISSPQSLVGPEVLGSLPDKTLPEVDQPLLSQLRTFAKMGGPVADLWLKQKAAVAVRFATSSIYPDLMTIYTENVERLTISSRAALLAYLAKQNEREALPLIEQQLAELPANQEFNFLPQLTSLYYSDGIEAILRKRLESDQPEIASTTAYLIGKYGDANGRKILEARLERWRREWSGKPLEADANQQGRIESELVSALNSAKDGRIAPERVKELQQSCVTKICKQRFPTPRP